MAGGPVWAGVACVDEEATGSGHQENCLGRFHYSSSVLDLCPSVLSIIRAPCALLYFLEYTRPSALMSFLSPLQPTEMITNKQNSDL